MPQGALCKRDQQGFSWEGNFIPGLTLRSILRPTGAIQAVDGSGALRHADVFAALSRSTGVRKWLARLLRAIRDGRAR